MRMYAITLAAVWRVRYVYTHAVLRVRARNMCAGYTARALRTLRNWCRYRHVNRNLSNHTILRYALRFFARLSTTISPAGPKLEITVKHPTFHAISYYLVSVPIRSIVRRVGRNFPHCVSTGSYTYTLLERPDNFLGKINHIQIMSQFRVATFITVTAGTI